MAQSKKGMVNRNMKKFLLVLCIAISLLGLTACEAAKPVSGEDEELLKEYSSFVVEYILAENPEVYQYFAAQTKIGELNDFVEQGSEYTEFIMSQLNLDVEGYGFITGITSWQSAQAEAGSFVGIDENSIKVAYNTKGNGFVVDVDTHFSDRDAVVELTFDDNLNKTLESVAVNINYTFGEKMSKAGLNTLLGMGTVFIVLILLSVLIGCFTFINKAQTAAADKKKAAEPVKAAPAVVAEPAVENLADDGELVAVISAAIAAYEAANGNSTDGYFVRSIRRRPNNKWNKN